MHFFKIIIDYDKNRMDAKNSIMKVSNLAKHKINQDEIVMKPIK